MPRFIFASEIGRSRRGRDRVQSTPFAPAHSVERRTVVPASARHDRSYAPTASERINHTLRDIGGPSLVETLATILEYNPSLILPVIREERVPTMRASLSDLRIGGRR